MTISIVFSLLLYVTSCTAPTQYQLGPEYAGATFSTFDKPSGGRGSLGNARRGNSEAQAYMIDPDTGKPTPVSMVKLDSGDYTFAPVKSGSTYTTPAMRQQPQQSWSTGGNTQNKGFQTTNQQQINLADFFGGGSGGSSRSASTVAGGEEETRSRFGGQRETSTQSAFGGFGGENTQSSNGGSNGGAVQSIFGGFGGGSSRLSSLSKGGNSGSTGASEDKPAVKMSMPSGRIDIPLRRVGSDYLGKVSVGTPGQEFSVLFDTGSPHFVLVSKAAEGSYSTRDGVTPSTFDPESSTSHRTQNTPMEQAYGTGSFQGHWSHDVVQLGTGANAIVLQDQGFAEVTSVTDLFQEYDAIFGLAIIDKNVIDDQVDTPLMRMRLQYNNVPVFGVFFGITDNDASKIVIGGNDNDMVVSSFNPHELVQVTESGKTYYYGWNVKLDGIELSNGQVVDVQAIPRVCLDTGATAIAGPAEFIDSIQQKIFASVPNYDRENSRVPCDGMEVLDLYLILPDVTFVLGGQKYVVKPYDYLYNDGTGCKAGFIETAVENEIILGRMFLKKYYTKFDYMNKRVYIAKAKQIQSDEEYAKSLNSYKAHKQRQG